MRTVNTWVIMAMLIGLHFPFFVSRILFLPNVGHDRKGSTFLKKYFPTNTGLAQPNVVGNPIYAFYNPNSCYIPIYAKSGL